LRDKTAFFIKTECGGVTAPYVQGEVVAPTLSGKSYGGVVELLSHVLAAKSLVNTQIVDI
jgi:hypothetical protein